MMLAELRQKSQVTMPKEMDELRAEIDDVKAKISAGEQPTFDSIDTLFDKQ